MQHHALKLATALLGMTVVAACGSSKTTAPANITYVATLRGTNEVPSNSSPGTGSWTGTLNPSTKVLTYTMTFQGLSGTASLSHIHGPATATTNAGVLVNFAAPPTGHTGTLTLNGSSGGASGTLNLGTAPISATISGDSLLKLLDAGALYVNVHSSPSFGGGEIRGMISRQP